ncbi:MAG: type IA DNA topoisomerase [Lachnospiraceae bacterium]|nr:type IA DNA topoisomerase [Lachnospiraceae bacterium]
MGKTLIITEKPSVAREYAEILNVRGKAQGYIENDSYVITWCVGHLVEMCYPEKYDEKYKKWRLEDLPFLPEQYKYAVIKDVSSQYKIVNGFLHSRDVDTVLWAGDSGREGQTIEELIRMQGGVRPGLTEKRVWIDSTTREEIERGIREAKPYEAYRGLSDAGVMRGIEDYAMGINFSRVLSVRYGGMLNKAAGTKKYSAIAVGRVMTCVLGMVVKKERQIREFKETLFYRIIGAFSYQGLTWYGDWKAVEGSSVFASPMLYNEKGFLKEEDAASFVKELLSNKRAVVSSVSRKQEKKKPPLLFNLAELQSECSKRFKISPEETLKIAQSLYEKKLTTYPRTDARVLTTAVAGEIEKNIKGLSAYAPASEYVSSVLEKGTYKNLAKTPYVNDKKVTDHYAIIPTGVTGGVSGLKELEKAVYDLIVRRFLSIFYPPAVFEKLGIVTLAGKEAFFTNAKTLKESGYYAVTGQDKKAAKGKSTGETDTEDAPGETGEETAENDPETLRKLSELLKKGTEAELSSLSVKTGKTSPPKRYTSGSMILAMENAGNLIEDETLREQISGSGIGTSATRAGIIEKLVKIGYLALNKKTQILTPKPFGEMVYEVVLLTIPSMLNPEMTASWEKGLSGVEKGEITPLNYRETLEKYVTRYVENVKSRDLSGPINKNITLFLKEAAEFKPSSGRKSKGAAKADGGNQNP